MRAAAEAERQHKEFCENALREARLRGEEGLIIQGPKGRCNPSIFGVDLQNFNQSQASR